jgi:hypothetical protein
MDMTSTWEAGDLARRAFQEYERLLGANSLPCVTEKVLGETVFSDMLNELGVHQVLLVTSADGTYNRPSLSDRAVSKRQRKRCGGSGQLRCWTTICSVRGMNSSCRARDRPRARIYQIRRVQR